MTLSELFTQVCVLGTVGGAVVTARGAALGWGWTALIAVAAIPVGILVAALLIGLVSRLGRGSG